MAKIIHVCLEVSDLPRAIAFYRAAFGLAASETHDGVDKGQHYRLVYLKSPESEMEIELIRWLDRADLPPPTRREMHIALAVDDLDAEHRRLSALCTEIDAEITDYGAGGAFACRYFYLRDPDGNVIEVMARSGRYQ